MEQTALVVALAQMEVVAGQPRRNFETMARTVAQAKQRGADMVVFPEMAVGGRFLADKWGDAAYMDMLESYNDVIRALSDGIGIVFGNVATVEDAAGRKTPVNAALFAQDGAWVPRCGNAPAGLFVKRAQGEWRLFGEERYFTPAQDLGLDLAADGGNSPAPFKFRLQGEECLVGLDVGAGALPGEPAWDRVGAYGDAACAVTVQISSCPWTWSNGVGGCVADAVGACPNTRLPHVFVNAAGMQNTVKNVFALDGGSAAYAAGGVRIARCRDDFEEDLVCVELALRDASAPAAAVEGSSYGDEYEKALDAILSSLRRFDAQVFPFKPKWIIGLSGGIDSSVTAALLRMALDDPARIVGYNLATRYNSDATKMNAYDLAQALGIRLVNGSIEELVAATDRVLEGYGYPESSVSGLAQENIQARLRGHLLSTFAAVEGGVVMNNGNKVEVALGYATLYGDAIGALSPIGDVTKVQLFELTRRINRRLGAETIPENLIPSETDDGYDWQTMPSAELKDAQKDPMKWFYHDWVISQLLDEGGLSAEGLLEAYLDDRLLSSEVGKWVRFYGLDDPASFIEDFEWVTGQMAKSVFKRLQLPPGITITRGACGFDHRESQVLFEPTERYLELRNRVLALPKLG